MANTTVRGAEAIHGQNPQFLVETVIRNRIYESPYWKEHCFALTAESLIDRAIELKCIGGFSLPSLKLLQIQPEKEILLEYLQADEFKYLRALATMYIRMTFRSVEVYEILEPLLKDTGNCDIFVDNLLVDDRVCDIILPRLTKRDASKTTGIGLRLSFPYPSRSRSGSRTPYRSRSRSISPDRLNGGSPRYRSRSRSISPDRMLT
ncbi:PRP38 family-domain-containing protein [Fomitopsis serialis]|uniref:PRP38 family-domain-containing protein n=1 Tax=Fomitopsis serialis TaxID=139415 RepID=UPI002008CF65|nr:PRP38 family-domain-containing protein [Neoantrodia serialis]KAH9934856.1 PRP38 family-domain-containing protein [Neoantrodia serialis]